MKDKSIGELSREYQATVDQLPVTLEGYAALSKDARNQIRDRAFELDCEIGRKIRESRHLTWFGVKV